MKKLNNLGMPIQCIYTRQALVNAYGEDKAVSFIQGNIDSLSLAYYAMKDSGADASSIMNIAIQSDFWNQTKVATEGNNLMELLKEAKEKLYIHNVDPLTQRLDESSKDFEFIKLLETLVNP
jgi:hypothetical protein